MGDRAAWKNFGKEVTEKRGTKKNTSGVKILEEECVTVQRLSAEVSGKAQKYTRVGAREFVPFEYDEVTVENIKRACLSHFDVREDCVCDVFTADMLRGINLLLRAVHAFGVDFIGDAFGEIFITFALRAFFLGISSVFPTFSSPSMNLT